MHIKFAERCAWRAAYLYSGNRQIAHIGLDPTGSSGPQIFGRVARHSFRASLPHIRWDMVRRFPCLHAPYQVQGRILSALDGRW